MQKIGQKIIIERLHRARVTVVNGEGLFYDV
jgi:hypothetical protein